MKHFNYNFSFVIVVLVLTSSTIGSSDSAMIGDPGTSNNSAIESQKCVPEAKEAIAEYTSLAAQRVAAAALTEKNKVQSEETRIVALEAAIEVKAKEVLELNNALVVLNETAPEKEARLNSQALAAANVAIKESVLIAGLRASEVDRHGIFIAKAVEDALASTKYINALNTALVACAKIATLPDNFTKGSCGYDITNELAAEIASSSKYIIAAALAEKDKAQAAAAKIAALKLSVEEKSNAVLKRDSETEISNESQSKMNERLKAQAAAKAFVSVQAKFMILGLVTTEANHQEIVTAQAAADEIAQANYFVALDAGIADCAAISALVVQNERNIKNSCAYNATLDTERQIKSNLDKVNAVALLERNTARAGAAEIAKAESLDLLAFQKVLISNNAEVNDAYPNSSPSELSDLLYNHASTAVKAARSRATLIAVEDTRGRDAAALAEEKAIKAANILVALNAVLAAC